ncbi:unnamed protein product [Symbiodinium pilosum]|uniref:Uncharacterized protein n=1 Tax=Symbiodinium pilosum TaxID=2952 RepID=A0A812RHV6_SYMPI|nr:unnamed protein product [Symbiodinium pilosum]
MSINEQALEVARQANHQYSQQAAVVGQPVHQAAQQMFWEQRRKRGPHAGLFLDGDAGGATDRAEPNTVPQPPQSTTTPGTGLFQPVVLETDVAYQSTANSMGVDIRDQTAMESWLGEQITTRVQVLQTIRHYHTAVIRPELYNLINQVETTLLNFDDRLLRQNRELQWLCSDNRAEQRRASGMTVLLTGFPATSPPAERHFMINWMLAQVDSLKTFLRQRGNDPDSGSDFIMFQVLTADPTTPPAGSERWSTVCMIHFKSWESRSAFMAQYGGAAGVPYYRDSWTPVRNTHIRATPASPQFQRKLELPLRVILKAINTIEADNNQVVILWKTLTVMKPQAQRTFDEQIEAVARLHYATEQGQLTGVLEVNPYLWDLLKTNPPSWAMSDDTSVWDYAWNVVVFGIQHELDLAERELYSAAHLNAKGDGKGLKVGRPPRHWTGAGNLQLRALPLPNRAACKEGGSGSICLG